MTKIGINTTVPSIQMHIKCSNCDNESKINTNFEINIIGMIQFKCKKCKAVFNAPDVAWAKISYATSPTERLIINSDGSVGI